MSADTLTYGWPWLGLVVGVGLLMLLAGTDVFRSPERRPRLEDATWLAWVGVAIYMLHQFEEHGIDLLGRRYAFHGAVCGMLGFSSDGPCPVPVAFITAVNLGTVWGATVLSAMLGRGRPFLALVAFGIPLVNAVMHLVPMLVQRTYNPGAFSAAVLFVPVCSIVVRAALRDPGVGRVGLVGILVSGVLLHVILLGSLRLYLWGYLGEAALVLVQVANGFVPAMMAWAMRGWRMRVRVVDSGRS